MANRFASVRTSVGLTIYDILPKEWVGRVSQCSDSDQWLPKPEELAACKTLASTGFPRLFTHNYILTLEALA